MAEQKQTEKQVEDKNWKKTSAAEMKIFIFIQFMFGIRKLPDAAHALVHWPPPQNASYCWYYGEREMSKTSQYFHLNDNLKAPAKGDNNCDPLYKVKPLLEVVQENSRLYYHPGRDISVNKARIKFNHRLGVKQYMKGE